MSFDWKDAMMKSALAGAIGTVGSMLTHGDVMNYEAPFMGMQMPTNIAAGLSCAVGSLATDFVHEQWNPSSKHYKDNKSKAYASLEDTALSVATSGGVTALLVAGNGAHSDALFNAALLGAGSHALTEAIYHPMMNAWGWKY